MSRLTRPEQIEQVAFARNLDAYLGALDLQRKELIVDEVTGHKRKRLESEVDHAGRPSDAEFFRWNELWWKAWGP